MIYFCNNQFAKSGCGMVAKGIFTPLDSLYIKELSNYVEKWPNFNFTWVRTLEMESWQINNHGFLLKQPEAINCSTESAVLYWVPFPTSLNHGVAGPDSTTSGFVTSYR